MEEKLCDCLILVNFKIFIKLNVLFILLINQHQRWFNFKQLM